MNIRRLPGWQVVRRLKRARIRQADIAAAVGCSDTVVSRTINRDPRKPDNELSERIWQEIERVLEADEPRRSLQPVQG